MKSPSYNPLSELELPLVRTRNGDVTYLDLRDYAGIRIRLIIECQCGRGDSGELFVDCPTRTNGKYERIEHAGICCACESKLTTRIFVFQRVIVDPVFFTKEDIDRDTQAIVNAREKWSNRPRWQKVMDFCIRRKLQLPKVVCKAPNTFAIEGMCGYDLAVSANCPHCGIGRTSTVFVPRINVGVEPVRSFCLCCLKEVDFAVNFVFG